MTYNKLVRDCIPEIIEQTGRHAEFRTLDEGEFRRALLEKLVEEAIETREATHSISSADDVLPDSAPMATELADVLEVLEAICAAFGLTLDEIKVLQEQRRLERGGFEKRLCLLSVE